MNSKLGIIGGTGFYDLPGITIKDKVLLETPFGKPSDEYIVGEISGKEVIFLPRHGKGHTIMPTNINYRANVYGMKLLGVTHLISISAVGSFKDEIEPGTIVFVDQFFDRTKQCVQDTFFDGGIAVHIAFSDPVCPVLHRALIEAGSCLDSSFTPKGVYLNMEGPAFSTRAESVIYKSWGVDVIGMTNLYEARLCREAEIHFATIAQVTDYDSWRGESVDVPTILNNLKKATEMTNRVIRKIVDNFPPAGGDCKCENALKDAIVTDVSLVTDEIKSKYWLLLKKYL